MTPTPDRIYLDPGELPRKACPPLSSLQPLAGPTIPNIGHRLFTYSPSTILKLVSKDSEGTMTALAHCILGSCVPRVIGIVTVPSETSNSPDSQAIPARHGIILSRQPGTPLSELWPSLTPPQRETIKSELCDLLVRMRAAPFPYYGRPTRKPYLLFSEFGTEAHACCTSRAEWDDSRIRALHASDTAPSLSTEQMLALERVQRETAGADGWDRPVLTHGDLGDRNILVDPSTLTIEGFLDWEMANIMPAYFEYVQARLSGGHQPEWRREILDVLRRVLQRECVADSVEDLGTNEPKAANVDEGEEKYKRTLAAWNAMVDVERYAQGYDDRCYWTFETGLANTQAGRLVL